MKNENNNSKSFREAFLKEINFESKTYKNYILYQNMSKPENGFIQLYKRENCYDFGLAEYTIDHSFSLSFHNNERILRFGTVYDGTTKFQLENKPVSSFSPASFLVVENNIKGKQAWYKGQHFRGAEITIYENYFKRELSKFKTTFNFDFFKENITYHYLPLDIYPVLQRMERLAQTNCLNALHLESCILQCIAIILESMQKSPGTYVNQPVYKEITIGKNRTLHLNSHDISSIQKAHEILSETYTNPPTIEALSEMVLLNQQKLKAGFKAYYHVSLGTFVNHMRMSLATNLLCSTEMTVNEIAREVGYLYTSNFTKMFKQTYGCTPLTFRNKQQT